MQQDIERLHAVSLKLDQTILESSGSVTHCRQIIATKDACLLNFSKTLRDAEQKSREERQQLLSRIAELERDLTSALQKLSMAGRSEGPNDHHSRIEHKNLESSLLKMQDEMASFQSAASREIMSLRRTIQEREQAIYQLKMNLMKANRLLTVSKAQRHEHYLENLRDSDAADHDRERQGERESTMTTADAQSRNDNRESESAGTTSKQEALSTSLSSWGTHNSKPLFEQGDRFVEVNGINVEESSIEEIKSILRSSEVAIPVKIRKSNGQLVAIKARYPDTKKCHSNEQDGTKTSQRADGLDTETENVTS